MSGIKEARDFGEICRGEVLVEIYKPDCKPCQQLEPVLQQVSGDYSGRVSFYKVPYTNEQILRRLGDGRYVTPTILLLRDGEVVEHFPGARYSKGIGSERVAARSEFLRRKLTKFLSMSSKSVTIVGQESNAHYNLETQLTMCENSLVTLKERYLKKNELGEVIEKPEDLFMRVASNIAEIEKKYGKTPEEIERVKKGFYEMMASLQFMPNSPTLMNAGRDLQQLSACFVLPVGDSIEEIFEATKKGAIIHKSGGGTGYSFSRIRPKSSRVKSTSGVASGPVSFTYAFNAYTDAVKQGGTRRGANMGILRVDHPDIQEFIHAKGEPNENNRKIIDAYKRENHLDDDSQEIKSLRAKLLGTQLNNFNISAGLTRKFMEAYERNEEFELIDPNKKTGVRRIRARELLEEIVDQAWESGDPGIIFLDRINEYNPTPQIGEIESTNPCGEQPLLPYESCNLGSINLAKFVVGGKINYDGLRNVVHNAVHFLDNVIDANRYPLPEIEEMTIANRKIGLGVMGFADMLAMLRLQYGSDDSLEVAEDVMKSVRDEARKASVKLAEERAVFLNWSGSIYDPKSPYFKGGELKLRNATLTTIAPTGTISMIADCESGIEPPFSLAYTRTVMDGKVLHCRARGLEHVLREEGFDAEGIFSELEQGKRDKFNQLPDEIKKLAVTAMTLSPEQHIKMQAAFQKYTDNAVSKTINLPNSATREDIKQAYLLSYKLGCKGITVYRDGCKDVQVLETKVQEYNLGSPLPKERVAIVRQEEVGDGKRIFVITGYWENGKTGGTVKLLRDTGRPTEVFVASNFFDPSTQSLLNALCIRVSKDLRKGISPEEIAGDLENLPPSDEVGFDEIDGRKYVNRSIPEAIGRAVSGWKPPRISNENDTNVKIPEEVGSVRDEKTELKNTSQERQGYCQNCGKYGVIRKEGCDKCIFCEYSTKGCG